MMQADSDGDGTQNITQHFRESEIFLFEYQALHDSQQHWVMFLSHRDVASMAIEYGGDIIGLDATHNVTCYKNTYLFAIMGRCSAGAIPLGYFVSTLKDEKAISTGLSIFKEQVSRNKLVGDQVFQPKAICIDMDSASNNAIRSVFPTSLVVLCHYHFMVNMVNQARSGVHGFDKEGISNLMSCVRQLCSSRTIRSFQHALGVLKSVTLFTNIWMLTI
tara:strand:+ start:668 stop:1321 length:654 start_codon:yes stop_codon:yes gene_type:complete